MPKKSMAIEGVEVKYVLLPSWFCDEATAFTRRSTQAQMIFTPTSEQFQKYTVYHEYIECCAILENGLFSNMDVAREKIEEACNALLEEIPDIRKRLLEYVVETDDAPHAFALVLELALAKRELSPLIYSTYWQSAVNCRLLPPPK